MRLATFLGLTASIVVLTNIPLGTASADDWSGWMGNQRDGVYRETGIVDEVPKDGLRIKWRKQISAGYAGPAAAGNHVYVFDYKTESGTPFNDPGQRSTLMGKERLTAVERGRWRADLASMHTTAPTASRIPMDRVARRPSMAIASTFSVPKAT